MCDSDGVIGDPCDFDVRYTPWLRAPQAVPDGPSGQSVPGLKDYYGLAHSVQVTLQRTHPYVIGIMRALTPWLQPADAVGPTLYHTTVLSLGKDLGGNIT